MAVASPGHRRRSPRSSSAPRRLSIPDGDQDIAAVYDIAAGVFISAFPLFVRPGGRTEGGKTAGDSERRSAALSGTIPRTPLRFRPRNRGSNLLSPAQDDFDFCGRGLEDFFGDQPVGALGQRSQNGKS